MLFIHSNNNLESNLSEKIRKFLVNSQLRKNLYWRNFDCTWRGFNEWILVLIIGFVIQNRRGHGGHDESSARRALPACRKLRKRSLLSNFLGPNLRHHTGTLVRFLKRSSKNHQPDFTSYSRVWNRRSPLNNHLFNQIRFQYNGAG